MTYPRSLGQARIHLNPIALAAGLQAPSLISNAVMFIQVLHIQQLVPRDPCQGGLDLEQSNGFLQLEMHVAAQSAAA